MVWIHLLNIVHSPVPQLIHEARHGDGIQVDDHFFYPNYTRQQFLSLSYQYNKPIFCSIQPFQSDLVSDGMCNQLDVQCYTSKGFQRCLALADRLRAVVSLFDENTLKYRSKLGGRSFNVFLWPSRQRNYQRSYINPWQLSNPLSSILSLFQPSQSQLPLSVNSSDVEVRR